MWAYVQAGETAEDRWAYGRHTIYRSHVCYVDDDGEVRVDVTILIDGWEEFIFYDAQNKKTEIEKLFKYLDKWDANHPRRF